MQYRILYTYTITCIIMYISTQWRSIDAQTIDAQIHRFHPHGQIEFKPMQKDTVTLLHLLGLEAYTHTSHKHHQTIRPCLSPRHAKCLSSLVWCMGLDSIGGSNLQKE